MIESGFLILLLFFSEFFCRGRVWSEFGTKFFFFSFSAYLISFWLKIRPERVFLIFFNFLAIFFRNFLAKVENEQNSGQNFFSLFLGLSHHVLAKNKAGKRFFNFLLSFSEFSCSGRVWMEVGTKIFFSLSRIITSRFG